ncbi:helical backbone metal receptor [Cesiribacter andamanensis]|uniref:Vitamin B12-binding protein n=1 Tax=Cesiribacter andamanensis AMV16 TaxID=1279009 RepID=M7MWL6_9BACT|nr:helical backbone metal receptor [Cesiribacter andamanensis]EMR00798.1 Vitamin B12-binding protein precursor [Cesiribacter andamanensis AMV16]
MEAKNHRSVTDQMGREIRLPWPPRRIISLVPSQTELLYHLGLEEQVVGITKFCVHPPHWRKQKTLVGGTKTLHPELIRQLQPDLIIGNKEENEQQAIESLATEFPVWMSDIACLEDALEMMRRVGEITGRAEASEKLVSEVIRAFAALPAMESRSALYLIWRKPWMGVGHSTFIHQMLTLIGLRNVLEDQARYPELSEAELQRLNPEVVLLSSEPYPFQEKHLAELQALLPQSRLLLVDGELFSWYGSRLLQAPAYFKELQQELLGK